MEPLEDQELSAILREWQAPPPPLRLREKLFPAAASWWKRLWQVQIRIPLPVAACLALLLAAGLWFGTRQRHTAAAQSGPGVAAEVLTFRQLTPVKELKPRIIRRERAN